MKKKFIAMVTAFAIAAYLPVCAFASVMENESYQSAMVSYDVPGSYMVYIPMDIVVGDRISLFANELNILDSKAVEVRFSGLNDNGSVTLYNEIDSNSSIEVFFHHGTDGRQVTNSDSVIGMFTMDDPSHPIEFFSSVDVQSGTKAGHYTGNVNFVISYVDKL